MTAITAVAGRPRTDVRGRLVYRLRALRREPIGVAGGGLGLLLVYLVIAPIVSMLAEAVIVAPADSLRIGQAPGTATTFYLDRTLSSPISTLLFWDPLVHTVITAVGVTGLRLALGAFLAWLRVRTDTPAR